MYKPSPRSRKDKTVVTSISRRDYTAFGEGSVTPERAAGLGYAGQSETRKGYTGYEKDAESSLEFAQARYYSTTRQSDIVVSRVLPYDKASMSDVLIELPDALAKEAREAGILRSDYVASMFRREIKRRRINKLFSAADRLAESAPSLTEADIAEEIEAYRRENRDK